ncbi:carbamoyl-phosphate synthase [Synechococcus sp. MIT S1220]|uniref:carbamoyl-phosphate synthase n=1 Tax=Synechococcus sp. MIT S1220 TaxID=3082549 RepID=UPI0039AEFE55
MLRFIRLSLSLGGAAALAIANTPLLPAAAQEADTAEDLGGVMSISLADVVKPTIGFQGALQGAGTPNQAGIGGFLPLSVGENSVWFLDALVNANFADREGYSSIINTDVAGGTVSTSTRIGYRWLNGDRSWMFGLNGGYDSRPVKSGGTDTGISVTDKRTAFFQQIALNAEAVSNSWTFNAYGLLPVGDVEQKLNSFYQGGAMNTYGLDVGYFITPALHASAGYYYQHREEEHIDGSAVRGRLAYEISDGLTAGLNVSHDFQESDHFETRVSADLKVRFGGARTTAMRKKVQQLPVINALTSTPSNRDVRVHDLNIFVCIFNIWKCRDDVKKCQDKYGAKDKRCR